MTYGFKSRHPHQKNTPFPLGNGVFSISWQDKEGTECFTVTQPGAR